MRVEKIFKIQQTEWNLIDKFYIRVATFMKEEYGCDIEQAIIAIKNAMAFDWALCNGIGIQTNVYRDTIYIGK